MVEPVDHSSPSGGHAVVLAGFAGALGVGLHELIARDPELEPVMAEIASLNMAIAHFGAAVALVNVDTISSPLQLRRLAMAQPAVGIVLAVAHAQRERDDRLLAAGARAVLPITVDACELRAVLRLVARGLIGTPAPRRGGRDDGLAELTSRETEVVELLLQRRTGREIAEALYISTTTVNTHRRRIYQKLGVHSRGELQARVLDPRERGAGSSSVPLFPSARG